MSTQQETLRKNLYDIIRDGDDGYKLTFGYSLELVHGLAGYFPALSQTGENKGSVIYSNDLTVIEDIWKKLGKQASRINQHLFYVHIQTGEAHGVVQEYGRLAKYPSIQFITREKFDKLSADSEHTFRWASGLFSFSPDMTEEVFTEYIKKAIAEMKNPKENEHYY